VQANTFRNQLIADHSDIARRIALKVARRCPDWVQREDLIAAGMLGLTEAALRYDETRTEPFLSFAEQRIRGAVLDELRRGDLLPRRVRQLARKVNTAIRAVEATGETATDQTVADKFAAQQASRDIAPDEAAGHRQLLQRVRAALDKLEQRDVTILGLHYIEDMTYQEIAKSLGITPSRVCQLLWRAVERLRGHLGVTALEVKAAA